jgi:hypothetical protein
MDGRKSTSSLHHLGVACSIEQGSGKGEDTMQAKHHLDLRLRCKCSF